MPQGVSTTSTNGVNTSTPAFRVTNVKPYVRAVTATLPTRSGLGTFPSRWRLASIFLADRPGWYQSITKVILCHVKTAISLPDELFEAADRLAARLGRSRSELYATAVAEYLDRHRFEGVTERLDAVYETKPDDSRLDPVLDALQLQSLPKEEW